MSTQNYRVYDPLRDRTMDLMGYDYVSSMFKFILLRILESDSDSKIAFLLSQNDVYPLTTFYK